MPQICIGIDMHCKSGFYHTLLKRVPYPDIGCITKPRFALKVFIDAYLNKISIMTREEKKEWAKLIFLRENLTQKEISQKVGATEKTISKWVNEGNWDKHKASIIITKEEELRRMYDQLKAMNDAICLREQGQRFATSKEADVLSKLSTTIKNMETDIALADVIEVSKRLINWVRKVDYEKAKELTVLFDGYIREILKH
jgi:transcriptional regulator with XRE-family HTH domain